MIKFWLIYLLGVYIAYKSITARKTKELARMQIEERWSELRIVINDLLFPVRNVFGILLIVFLLLGMTFDLPNVIRHNVIEYDGKIKEVKCRYFCLKQIVFIENEDHDIKLKIYFSKDIVEDGTYSIEYLPRTRMITSVEEFKHIENLEEDE